MTEKTEEAVEDNATAMLTAFREWLLSMDGDDEQTSE